MDENTGKNYRNDFKKGALLGALATFILMSILMVIFINRDTVIESKTERKLQTMKEYIDKMYLKDIDEEELIEGIYAGYIAGLNDPYSVYYNEQQTKELLESMSGEYSGVGALLSQDRTTGVVTMVQIFKGSPAEESGIKDGDVLETVNGEEVTGQDLSNVVSKIKGEEGTDVELGILRGSNYESLTVTVTRRTIENPTVSYEMKEDKIGYILVSEFDLVTLEQFEEALGDLKNQGMEGLVIDLRNNPGGSLSTVCEMLELLLPEGLIVYTEDKNGNTSEYTATGENEFDKPMVVLMNQYSASASEIFAGAVQDYGIAKIVGTTSYGKGVVQQMIDLKDGTYMKITISQYFTPKGRSINEVGIEPDVEVELETTEENRVDNQLEKAIEIVNESIQ